MTDPLELMDEIDKNHHFNNGRTVYASEWQSLRTAIEAQRDELAQKDARIARLDEGLVDCCKTITDFLCGDETEEDLHGCLVRVITLREEHPRQSAAALKAEALREWAYEAYKESPTWGEDVGWNRACLTAQVAADDIEREAKEQGEQQ